MNKQRKKNNTSSSHQTLGHNGNGPTDQARASGTRGFRHVGLGSRDDVRLLGDGSREVLLRALQGLSGGDGVTGIDGVMGW